MEMEGKDLGGVCYPSHMAAALLPSSVPLSMVFRALSDPFSDPPLGFIERLQRGAEFPNFCDPRNCPDSFQSVFTICHLFSTDSSCQCLIASVSGEYALSLQAFSFGASLLCDLSCLIGSKKVMDLKLVGFHCKYGSIVPLPLPQLSPFWDRSQKQPCLEEQKFY